MGKMLRSDDVMPGCPAIIDGENAFDVVVRAREHAKASHGLAYLTAGLTALMHQAIREKPPRLPSSQPS
jgi:predicted small metal-binding protein